MKKIYILLLLLVGCQSVPTKRNFPEPPSDLIVSSKLILLDSNTTKISDLLQSANQNYGSYYILKAKNDAWIEWYKQQKNIWNSVK